MKSNSLLLYGGGAVALLLLFTKNSASSGSSNGTLTVPGAPAPPATYDPNYYFTYQYPAMLKANPNLGNPNYQLTPAEAAQYLINNVGVRQWSQTVVPNPFATVQQAVQYHFTTYGVALQSTFMPLMPPNTIPYTPVKANPQSSGGGSWLTSALGIATTIIGLLGVNDVKLNDKEVEVVLTGSAVILDILPMYYEQSGGMAFQIEDKVKEVVNQYAV